MQQEEFKSLIIFFHKTQRDGLMTKGDTWLFLGLSLGLMCPR